MASIIFCLFIVLFYKTKKYRPYTKTFTQSDLDDQLNLKECVKILNQQLKLFRYQLIANHCMNQENIHITIYEKKTGFPPSESQVQIAVHPLYIEVTGPKFLIKILDSHLTKNKIFNNR